MKSRPPRRPGRSRRKLGEDIREQGSDSVMRDKHYCQGIMSRLNLSDNGTDPTQTCRTRHQMISCHKIGNSYQIEHGKWDFMLRKTFQSIRSSDVVLWSIQVYIGKKLKLNFQTLIMQPFSIHDIVSEEISWDGVGSIYKDGWFYSPRHTSTQNQRASEA